MKCKIIVVCVILFLFPVTVFSGGWTSMSSGTTNGLSGIWGSTGSDVFAVGGNGTILHYDGNTWSTMASGTSQVLYDVWGSSGNDVFAVGSIILYYDGSTWTPSAQNLFLGGVWGSSGSDVFAVGWPGTILHYNGSTWSPMVSGTTTQLFDVWGSSASDVFAVGDSGKILHYDGNTWSAMASGTTIPLSGVWGISGSDVFAVGYSYLSGTCKILHYDGSTWSSIANFYDGTVLNGIWCNSGSDVFAVGNNGKILHYDGNTWSAMTSGTTGLLWNIWGSSGNDVFAVGSSGIILHYRVSPTAIDLSFFATTPKAGKVIISWSTESETDNAGFNIYRSESENGNYLKINPTPILTIGSSTQGASYEYVDNGLQNRHTYYYKLEDIDLNGKSTMHGPVSATPRWIFGIGK